MRKLVLSALMIAGFTCAFAQKIDDVKKDVDNQKYAQAREKLDKMLADPKNQDNADLWFYRAQVFSELATANPADTSLMGTAFQSMNRFVALDFSKPEAKRSVIAKLQNYRPLFNIYTAYFKGGAEAFQSKDYDRAFNNFERAVETFNVLSANKLVEVPFDTTSVLYAGVAAESAKKPEAAMKYYQQIVNLKIPDTTHLGIYGYMANYYKDKNDMVAASRIIDQGEAVFPNRDVWPFYRLDMAGADTLARLKKYEELMTKYPNNAVLSHDYAIEMYRYVYLDDTRVNDTVWLGKLKDAFRQSLAVKPTATNGFILTTILSDDANYMQNSVNRIKGTTPADVKRKKDAQAKLDAINAEMVKYGELTFELYEAMPSLKNADKANMKKVTQNLADYYKAKGPADKAAKYEAKLKTL
jgi:tetratricopeptide (TPR) repeat protein